MNQGDNNQKKLNINPETGEVGMPHDEQSFPIFEEKGTYCRIGSTSGGFLEMDLRSMKQKGSEDRFISCKVVGFDDQNQVTESEMLLLDEELFKKFKDFISKLNWND